MARQWQPVVAGLALLVLALCGLPAAAGPGDEPAFAGSYEQSDVDRTVIEIGLRPDGSAQWTIEHRIRLDDSNATRGFEGTQDRIEQNRSSFRDPVEQRVRAMATTAESETGRTMIVENVSVTTYREQVPREYGVIAYEFEWYGFAATNETLRVEDTLDGLFLDDGTTLLISWPDEADLSTVSPEPDERREGAVLWTGPTEFAAGEPRLEIESGTLAFGPDLSVGGGGNDILFTLGTFGAVVVGTGALVWRRRSGENGVSEEQTAADAAAESTATTDSSGLEADSTAPADPSVRTETDDRAVGPAGPGEAAGSADTDDAAGSADTDDAAGATDTDDAARATDTGEAAETDGTVDPTDQSPPDSTPPEELLSNEERVLRLLDEHGGRMKQQDIVDALDWSETKTSEVVTELRDEGTIEVYRLGRENVLTLPEVGLGGEDESGDESEEESQ